MELNVISRASNSWAPSLLCIRLWSIWPPEGAPRRLCRCVHGSGADRFVSASWNMQRKLRRLTTPVRPFAFSSGTGSALLFKCDLIRLVAIRQSSRRPFGCNMQKRLSSICPRPFHFINPPFCDILKRTSAAWKEVPVASYRPRLVPIPGPDVVIGATFLVGSSLMDGHHILTCFNCSSLWKLPSSAFHIHFTVAVRFTSAHPATSSASHPAGQTSAHCVTKLLWQLTIDAPLANMISSAAALYFRSSWLSILNEHPIRPVNYIRLEPIRPARWKEPKNPIGSLALPIHLPSRLISNLRIPIMSRIARSKWVFPFPLFLFLPPNNSIVSFVSRWMIDLRNCSSVRSSCEPQFNWPGIPMIHLHPPVHLSAIHNGIWYAPANRVSRGFNSLKTCSEGTNSCICCCYQRLRRPGSGR